jgi:hypothetical protein
MVRRERRTTMNAAETYKARLTEVRDLLRQLEGQLSIHARRQLARPADWGLPGDLDRIIDGLTDLIPSHTDRRCEWKHPTTCGEYAAYCMPDGRLICPEHAPESGYDPSECLDLETGLPADVD